MSWPGHLLAVEVHLRPILVELGATVPARGLFVTEPELANLDAAVGSNRARHRPHNTWHLVTLRARARLVSSHVGACLVSAPTGRGRIMTGPAAPLAAGRPAVRPRRQLPLRPEGAAFPAAFLDHCAYHNHQERKPDDEIEYEHDDRHRRKDLASGEKGGHKRGQRTERRHDGPLEYVLVSQRPGLRPGWLGRRPGRPGGEVGVERGQFRVGLRSERLARPLVELVLGQPALHERGLEPVDHMLAVPGRPACGRGPPRPSGPTILSPQAPPALSTLLAQRNAAASRRARRSSTAR